MNPELSLSNVPDDQTVKCFYCGREFSKQGLIAHLQNCPKRIRTKTLEMPYKNHTARFTVKGNMSRKVMRALYALEKRGDPVITVGGLFALREAQCIMEFSFEEIPTKNTVEEGNSSLEGDSSLESPSFQEVNS